MDTTHVNGHGRTEGALQAVQSKWCAPVPRLQMGGGAPFWERSDFSWVLSSRQPLMMWGALLAPPVRPYNSQDKSPPTLRPCQPWYRGDQIIPHRHTDLRLQERPEVEEGKVLLPQLGGLAEGSSLDGGETRPQSPACYTWPQSRF